MRAHFCCCTSSKSIVHHSRNDGLCFTFKTRPSRHACAKSFGLRQNYPRIICIAFNIRNFHFISFLAVSQNNIRAVGNNTSPHATDFICAAINYPRYMLWAYALAFCEGQLSWPHSMIRFDAPPACSPKEISNCFTFAMGIC